ncbi:hypothetical protein GIB67_001969 [Kingdonia uniflora]|uniref:Uncharacterized protein n=1 Tax=Kingdonia uniflora TaxID=39325 RepID=A0A7J7M9X3_9MAGN|nr:hypothetical protein GIB67_001969 [Kingdonia uniflora]
MLSGSYANWCICPVLLATSTYPISLRENSQKRVGSHDLRNAIFPAIVATCVCVVGIFASGEWRGLKQEMAGYKGGGVSYVMIWLGLLKAGLRSATGAAAPLEGRSTVGEPQAGSGALPNKMGTASGDKLGGAGWSHRVGRGVGGNQPLAGAVQWYRSRPKRNEPLWRHGGRVASRLVPAQRVVAEVSSGELRGTQWSVRCSGLDTFRRRERGRATTRTRSGGFSTSPGLGLAVSSKRKGGGREAEEEKKKKKKKEGRKTITPRRVLT